MPGPSPKKATPNTERVLGDLPIPVPIVTLPCEVMPRLTGKTLGFPDTLTECENGLRMEQGVGEPLTDDTGIDGSMATPDVDMAETAPDSTADMRGNDDLDNNDDEEPEFQYEKTRTYSFVPTIAEAEAAFADIKKLLKPP
jgi:hypothetical protein